MPVVPRLFAVTAILLVLLPGAAAVDVDELSERATTFFSEDVDEPVQELFFIVALPFILFFAIFIYLIRETSVLGPPSDGVVAVVFAIFAVRGVSPLLTDWWETRGGVGSDLPFSELVNALGSVRLTGEMAVIVSAAAGFLLLVYSRFYHDRDDPFAIDLSTGIVGGVGVFALLTGLYDIELFLIVTGVAIGAALVLQLIYSLAGFKGVLITAGVLAALWLLRVGIAGFHLGVNPGLLLVVAGIAVLLLLIAFKLTGGD